MTIERFTKRGGWTWAILSLGLLILWIGLLFEGDSLLYDGAPSPVGRPLGEFSIRPSGNVGLGTAVPYDPLVITDSVHTEIFRLRADGTAWIASGWTHEAILRFLFLHRCAREHWQTCA